MSSTITTTTTTTQACPYAALAQDEEALQQCPAFAHGTCPFKDATNATEIKQTLQQMPASHLKNNSFLHMLQEMHIVKATGRASSSSSSSALFQIPGGCPVRQLVGGNGGAASFRQALEQMSLSAIMARLMEEEDDEREEEQTHAESPHLAEQAITVSTTTTIDDDTSTTLPRSASSSLLSESLKTGTATSHQAAENVHFVQNFIQGKIDRDLYATMVGMLYHVYVALEECLDEHAVQHFASCHFPHELRRTETLASDVDFWWGSSTTTPPVSAATHDYVDRLQYLAQHDPLLLLAHAYTRYLGDLSGGKVLARVARRALHLKDGLEFYEFAHISSIKVFKDQYRQALDALSLTESQIQRIVAEANVAFCLNMRLFEELDVQANVPGALVRPLEDALAYATPSSSSSAASAAAVSSDECPFLKKKKNNNTTNSPASTTTATKRCPWPFVFAHDPAQGMKDWQTWLVLGLILCWVWNMWQAKLV